MFSISHSSDGAFRLEIHASPSELDPDEARRLRAVLLGLARELRESAGQASPSASPPTAPSSSPASERRRVAP